MLRKKKWNLQGGKTKEENLENLNTNKSESYWTCNFYIKTNCLQLFILSVFIVKTLKMMIQLQKVVEFGKEGDKEEKL